MKLAGALAVPLFGLFLITVIEVRHTGQQVSDVRAQSELARAAIGPSGVLSTLQDERTWAVVDLIGFSGQITAPVAGYDESRQATNEAIAAFRSTLADTSPAVARAYEPALDNLAELEQVRADIDANAAPRDLSNVGFADDVFGRYSALIAPFFDADTRVALAVDDAELRRWTTLVGAVNRSNETLANLARTTILEGVIGDGINQPAEIAEESRMVDALERLETEFTDAPEPFASVAGRAYPTQLVDSVSQQVNTGIEGGAIALDPFVASLNVPADEGFMGLRAQLTERLEARADELDNAAVWRQRIYVGVAIVTLTAAVILSWIVSRSITRPLRSLTRHAKDMAERGLPDAVNQILDTPLGEDVVVPAVQPLHLSTSDEVSDVAGALNTVQETALDLAVEQAVLRRNIADSFVNLGRRNQHLLGRQLDFITELESKETDPDALSNLFRLDHLATRMRRNAESLLVLAGFDPPRKWTAPVRLTDVIRAALGEVEDYHRVSVRAVEAATILGSAAADLAHLLAELVENALVFSPPDQTVDIRGRHRADGPPGRASYTLAVIDTGLGMTADDLTAANRRLAGAESFTIAPSKYLGHYVAGNLAARHGIRVHLDNSPGNGVTATITLPPDLLTTDEVSSAPVTPPEGQRAVRLRPGVAMPAPWSSAPPEDAPAPSGPGGPDRVGTPLAAGTPAPRAIPPAPPRRPGEPPPPPSRVIPLPAAEEPEPERPPIPLPPRLPTRPGAAPARAAGAAGPPRLAGRPRAAPPGIGPDRPGAVPPPGTVPGAGTAADRAPGHLPPRLPTRPPGPARVVTPPGVPPTGRDPVPSGPPPAAIWPRSLAPNARTGNAVPTSGQAGARPRDEDLLAALGRYAPGAEPGGAANGGPGGPGGASPGQPEPLTRRVPGAQMPETGVVRLRGDGLVGATNAPVGPAPRPTPAAHSAAADVQSLLTSFTAGVRRGLEEANATGNGRGHPR
jgi:signal transduction histidine kinase